MFNILNTQKSSTPTRSPFRLLNMSSLKDRMRKALDESKMNASELARKTNVSRATVSLWLNGQTQQLEGENLTRAASALEVDAHWLATGEGAAQSSITAKPVEPDAQAALSPRKQALLGLFDGLTETQQQELIRDLKEKKQQNDALLTELLKRRAG